MIALFWVCVGLILYTYFFYPVLIVVWALLFPRPSRVDESALPHVSMLVAAYNEEDVIERKLQNCRELDYPADRIEFLFGSDASSDRTPEILNAGSSPQVRPFLFQERAGKASVLNKIEPQATGVILVLSDANTMYRSDAVRKLVRHFADSKVGGVCGRLELADPSGSAGGQGGGLYWRYENMLKASEGAVSTVIGANGGIYAIRKELFRPVPTDRVLMDDFIIPLRAVEEGYRVVYEPEAVGTENMSPNMHGEFRREVRIAAANFKAFPYILGLLNPFSGFASLALWSHKVLRWIVPFLALAALSSNLLIVRRAWVYAALLAVQALVYLGALLGCAEDRLSSRRNVFAPFYYLVAMNLALLLGFFRSLTRTQRAAWERVPH